ncbi:MAG: hypothetical protein IVW57_19995, partial [Ktedonobacterales bacterium]|nr:hypothetical protein [Ktedonobacterales bacterium]
SGLVQGKNPRAVARDIAQAADVPLNQALNIARTEELTAYRTAAILNYQDNSDVLDGWVWSADLSTNTCGLCLSLNGSVHGLDEFLDSHNNCRCSPIPLTKGWQDILSENDISMEDIDLSDLPDTNAPIENGADWFARQTPEVQTKILGPSKAALYQTGQIKLADIVGHTYSQTWGAGLREKSLSDLGFDAQDVRLARAKLARTGPTAPASSTESQAQAAALRARLAALDAELEALQFAIDGTTARAQNTAHARDEYERAVSGSYGADRAQWPADARARAEMLAARAAEAQASAAEAVSNRAQAVAERQTVAESGAARRLATVNVEALDSITTIT